MVAAAPARSACCAWRARRAVVDGAACRLRCAGGPGAGEGVAGPVQVQRRVARGRAGSTPARLRTDERGRATLRGRGPRVDTRWRARRAAQAWVRGRRSRRARASTTCRPGDPVRLPGGRPATAGATLPAAAARRWARREPGRHARSPTASGPDDRPHLARRLPGRARRAAAAAGQLLGLRRLPPPRRAGRRRRRRRPVSPAPWPAMYARPAADPRSMYRVDRFGWSRAAAGGRRLRARWRPATPRPSTAATSSTARACARRTPTAARSTSTPGRTPTARRPGWCPTPGGRPHPPAGGVALARSTRWSRSWRGTASRWTYGHERHPALRRPTGRAAGRCRAPDLRRGGLRVSPGLRLLRDRRRGGRRPTSCSTSPTCWRSSTAPGLQGPRAAGAPRAPRRDAARPAGGAARPVPGGRPAAGDRRGRGPRRPGQLRGDEQHRQPVGAPPAPARRAPHQGRRSARVLLAPHPLRRRRGADVRRPPPRTLPGPVTGGD